MDAMGQKIKLIIWECRRALKLGSRKYSDVEREWKAFLDSKEDEEYDSKTLRNLVLSEYLRGKAKAILLGLVFVFFAIVAFAVAVAISKLLLLLIGHLKSNALPLVSYLQGATPDGWLDFWGSALGSIVTLAGLIITIRFERRQDALSRQKQAQPIIILQDHDREDQKRSENTKSSYSLYFRSFWRRPSEGGEKTCQLPDVIIRNVGLNAAINVHMEFSIDGLTSSGCRPLDYLPPNQSESIGITAAYCVDELDSVFPDRFAQFRADYPDFLTAYEANAYTHLDKETRGRIERVSGNEGTIVVFYNDIYGNSYKQYFSITFMVVWLNNDEVTMYISYPTYSNEPQS